MAVRRLNYTGRKRLPLADLRFAIQPEVGGAPLFSTNINLGHLKLPPNADVYVEAYRQTTWMRFRFGTVGDVRPVDELKLTEFDSPEGVLFRVRVTSPIENRGLLLAEADRIRPRVGPEDEDTNRIPLLPVKPDDNLVVGQFEIRFVWRP